MLKKVALIALPFLFVIGSGCGLPEPSLQDELREIADDLESAMRDSDFILEQCKELERELQLVNTWYEGEDIIGDSIFASEGMAEILVTQLSELSEDIGAAYYGLSDIIWDRLREE